jgi:hypothetical protein
MKSTKFKYVVNGGVETNPFIVRNIDSAVYYSLGEKFDNFKFRRHTPSLDLADEFLEKRIKQVRSKYNYIRVWFSGGKDSWLILDTAVRFNVHIDEIVIFRKLCENGLGLYKSSSQAEELKNSAFLYLEKIKHLIPNTKITVIDSDDPHYEAIFENKDWSTQLTDWFFSTTYAPNLFYKYINPKFKILEEIENSCVLFGSPAPSVTVDTTTNKWTFFLNDAKFSPVHGNNSASAEFEDFLFTEDFPELAELHVNYIVESLESEKIIEQATVGSLNETQRHIRDRSQIYHSASTEYKYQQNVKILPKNFRFPNNHFAWTYTVNPTGLFDRLNRFYQTPQPNAWKFYIENADWDLIKKQLVINTKSWILNDDK